jgi:hypothetical protein
MNNKRLYHLNRKTTQDLTLTPTVPNVYWFPIGCVPYGPTFLWFINNMAALHMPISLVRRFCCHFVSQTRQTILKTYSKFPFTGDCICINFGLFWAEQSSFEDAKTIYEELLVCQKLAKKNSHFLFCSALDWLRELKLHEDSENSFKFSNISGNGRQRKTSSDTCTVFNKIWIYCN